MINFNDFYSCFGLYSNIILDFSPIKGSSKFLNFESVTNYKKTK